MFQIVRIKCWKCALIGKEVRIQNIIRERGLLDIELLLLLDIEYMYYS